jgi:hypothetical protein
MFYDKDGKDIGYKVHQDWWFRAGDPDRYRYADIDSDYPAQYFPTAEPPRVKEFVDTVIAKFQDFAQIPLTTVVEFGCGGGWYSTEFQRRGITVRAFEGSSAGINACHARGFFNVQKLDLRHKTPDHSFADLAICTEVAEHIEPPFHANLVQHLTSHSNLVWFSSEPPYTNKPHLGHPGEMPLEYWIALFKFFGFECYMLSDEIYESTVWRGRCIFFKP